jgi:aminoglycoside phosphotransferase (APT) family kinase protein
MDRTTANTGTREVSERLRFDEAVLQAWLQANVVGFEGPLAVRQFKGGQSNPTYQLDTPSASYVLRRKPPGKTLPGAHAVDREYRVMAALGGQGFPVPRVHGLCEDEGVIGTAFFRHGHGAGADRVGSAVPRPVASDPRRALRRDERHDRPAPRP